MAEASIIMTLRDNVSNGLKSIENNARPLSKEFEELTGKIGDLKKKNDALNQSYADLSTKLIDAKKEMKDATSVYKENATETNRTNLSDATKHYKNLTDQVQAFKSASADTRKEIRNTQQDLRKMGNGSLNAENGEVPSLMKGLFTAGIGHMVGQTAQQASQYMISSAFSNEAGNTISSALGNAISGATMGAASGLGLPGMILGGTIGTVTGAVSGTVKNAEEKENAMHSYAQEEEQTAIHSSQTRAASSSTTAGKREQDQLAFSTLLGSSETASNVLSSINTMSNKTPYIYDDLTAIAKTLTVYGDKSKKSLMGHLTAIGDTGAALGLSTTAMDSVAQILGYMGSSEKLDSVKLKQLRLKGIGANQMLADSYGVSASQFSKMVSSGKVSGADAMNRLYEKLSTMFGGMSEKQSKTYDGLNSTIEGLKQNIEAAQGTAYNQMVKKGKSKEISLLDGATGKELSNMYNMIGKGKGIRKNRETRIQDEVYEGVLKGKKVKDSAVNSKAVEEIKKLHQEYAEAKETYKNGNEKQRMEAGNKMDGIKQEIDTLSDEIIDTSSYFDGIDANEKEVASYTGEITSILGAWKDKYDLDQTRSHGILSSIFQAPFQTSQSNRVPKVTAANGRTDFWPLTGAKSHAYGEKTVPYDNYLIAAHQGERLLTAEEARRHDEKMPNISITGNVFQVRKESDVSAIAAELARQIKRAADRSEL